MIDSHERLERILVSLRSTDPAAVRVGLGGLDAELRRHLDVAERYLYPLLAQLSPDDADEITRYPHPHERNAFRIIERLRVAQESPSTRMLDDGAVDVHRTVVELELRVLAYLLRHLDPFGRARLLDAELSALPSAEATPLRRGGRARTPGRKT